MTYRRAIVIGATGMLGKSFMKVLKENNIEPISLARSNSNYNINILDKTKVYTIISELKADLIINCAAIVSIEDCENSPILARKINADVLETFIRASSSNDSKFIQISTDHYYINDFKKLHNESEPITIVNQYAKSKRLGELIAGQYENSLIIRTNVTGIRGDKNNFTFIEWLYNALINKSPISLFTDFYTSTIDSDSLAKYILHSSLFECTGILNISSSECLSKKEFSVLLAKKMSIDINWVKESSVSELTPRRANSLGLDCNKAESLLGIKMPSAEAVICNLLKCLE